MKTVPQLAVISVDELRSIIKDSIQESIGNATRIEQNRQRIPKGLIRGVKGLAEFLGVSISTAQSIKNSGNIPYYQQGRIVFFEPDDVENAIVSMKTTSFRFKSKRNGGRRKKNV